MFTLHIEAHSIQELKRKALAAFDAPAQAEMELQAPKPAAKPKAAVAAPEKKEAEEIQEAPITAVDCKEILKQVITAKGMDYATQFILGFGVKKVTDLPKTRFAEFMSEAKKVLAE